MTDKNKEQGLFITRRGEVVRLSEDSWSVSSSSRGKSFSVDLGRQTCTCRPGVVLLEKCAHIYAVDFALGHIAMPDEYDDYPGYQGEPSHGEYSHHGYGEWNQERAYSGNTQTVVGRVKDAGGTQGLSATSDKERKTYPQNWPAYNKAQTREAIDFPEILSRFISAVPEPTQHLGRPRIPRADKAFACVFKVYHCWSMRRISGLLKTPFDKEYIGCIPHFNVIIDWMQSPELTEILLYLITVSGLSLKHIEHTFAIDGTGLSTSRFVRWRSDKYKRSMKRREFIKVHAICGVETNIITAAAISGWIGEESHDTNYFVPLLERTAKYYGVEHILADKAYLSRVNAEFAEMVGAVPVIPTKINTVITEIENTAWGRLIERNQDESAFSRYYLRGNIETVFSTIERLFQKHIRTAHPVAQVNEALCKLLCHNIVVLIHERYKNGIEPDYSLVEELKLFSV